MEVRYLFVLLSFVVMGAVSIFEWEMLFPDRIDFLVLSPLSLKPAQMLAAKAAALVGFLALFLVGCNLFAAIFLPAIGRGGFLHQCCAHDAAVLLAGIFAASFVLALGGVLLCVLDAARFRIASPIVQMLSVMALVLFLLHFAMYGNKSSARPGSHANTGSPCRSAAAKSASNSPRSKAATSPVCGTGTTRTPRTPGRLARSSANWSGSGSR